MAARGPLAAVLAATALFTHVQAWAVDLPACTAPFRPFVYSGCFADNNSSLPALSFRSDADFNNMTIEACMAECKGNDYRYAGLEYYGVCFCGNSVNGPPIAESNCDLACTGNQSEICGGNDIISIYQDPTFYPINDTTVADYAPLGCYFDNSPEGRALSYQQTSFNASTLTTDMCLSMCKSGGYPFAGTEYSGMLHPFFTFRDHLRTGLTTPQASVGAAKCSGTTRTRLTLHSATCLATVTPTRLAVVPRV